MNDRRRHRRRAIGAIGAIGAIMMTAVAAAGCAGSGSRPEPEPTPDPTVITFTGVGDIRFGDSRADLDARYGTGQDEGDCAPRFDTVADVSPVFADDRLVLLWAQPPVHTPEEIRVGTSVDTVRDTYPDAEELSAPPGTFRFDGLLVASGDRAYLLLHDGDTTQKLVAGFTEYCRRLFHENFGTC